MKTTVLLIVFATIAFGARCQDAEGFVLVKNEPPIQVHERWIEFPNKKPAVTSRELKTEFIVKAPIHKVIQAIRDEAQVKTWHSHLRTYKIYVTTDSTVWGEYSCHDIPWPLSDQDSFVEYKMTEIVPGSEYFIVFQSRTDNRAPVYEDINRVELIGSWQFILIGPGVVKVTYRVQSASPTNVPRLIVDPVIRNNLVSSVRSLTEIVER